MCAEISREDSAEHGSESPFWHWWFDNSPGKSHSFAGFPSLRTSRSNNKLIRLNPFWILRSDLEFETIIIFIHVFSIVKNHIESSEPLPPRSWPPNQTFGKMTISISDLMIWILSWKELIRVAYCIKYFTKDVDRSIRLETMSSNVSMHSVNEPVTLHWLCFRHCVLLPSFVKIRWILGYKTGWKMESSNFVGMKDFLREDSCTVLYHVQGYIGNPNSIYC